MFGVMVGYERKPIYGLGGVEVDRLIKSPNFLTVWDILLDGFFQV